MGEYPAFNRHHGMDFPPGLAPVVPIEGIILIDLPDFEMVIRVVKEPAGELDPPAQQFGSGRIGSGSGMWYGWLIAKETTSR